MSEETKRNKMPRVQQVEEVSYGIYVWECADGSVLGDGDGNILNVFCNKGDIKAIKAIREAAKSYGFEDGHEVWWSGHRPVTDSEYEHQLERHDQGLVPDPFDLPAINDEMEALKNGQR